MKLSPAVIDESGMIPVIEALLLAIALSAVGLAFYTYSRNKFGHSTPRAHVPHAHQSVSVSPTPSANSSELQTLEAEDQQLGMTSLATQTYREEQPQGAGAGPLYPDAQYGASITSCYVIQGEDGLKALSSLNSLFITAGWAHHDPAAYNIDTLRARIAQGLTLYGYSLYYNKTTSVGTAYADMIFPHQGDPSDTACTNADKPYPDGFTVLLTLEYLQ